MIQFKRREGMNFNPLDFMKNFQQMQEKISSVQQQLANIVVTGSAGGGMIEIDMNGKMELIAVRISEETMDLRDKDLLHDLIKSAHSQAYDKARALAMREMGKIGGGG
jgi:DNA-binding YbaB/EbfC family protein